MLRAQHQQPGDAAAAARPLFPHLIPDQSARPQFQHGLSINSIAIKQIAESRNTHSVLMNRFKSPISSCELVQCVTFHIQRVRKRPVQHGSVQHLLVTVCIKPLPETTQQYEATGVSGITLGCVIRQSTTALMALATGRESPAKPPMLAPVPVGTIRTAV